MQQIEAIAGTTGTVRQRVESVVETLATLHRESESAAEIAHDARNMVTALGLYCDLLEEPGVLAPAFAHYGGELRLVAAASRRLVEKLVALDDPAGTQPGFWRIDAPDTSSGDAPDGVGAASGALRVAVPGSGRRAAARWPARTASPLATNSHWDLLLSARVDDLAAELLATRNLLAALAGPAIALTVSAEAGGLPVRIRCEDLTRVLVNLVKNAVEAMPSGGRIQIRLDEIRLDEQMPEPGGRAQNAGGEANPNNGGRARWLTLAVEDNGPGIPLEALERIFESGYTAHAVNTAEAGKCAHRGLGLAISRSIVEAAGGRIFARNRALGGAKIVIELPVG